MLSISPKSETNEFWLNRVICTQLTNLLNNLTSRPDDPNLCGWRIPLYQSCLTLRIAILLLGCPIFLVSSSQFRVPSRALAEVLAAALFWVTMTAVARMLTNPVQVTRRGINKFSVGTSESTTMDVSAWNPLEVRQGIVSWALRVGFARGRAISFDRAERLLADDENQLKALIGTKENYWIGAAEGLLLVASVVATAWLLVSHLGSLHG